MCVPSLCLFLQNLYDSIKNEPFKIPEDDGNDLTHTFFNPDREGWLLKLGMLKNNNNNKKTFGQIIDQIDELPKPKNLCLPNIA